MTITYTKDERETTVALNGAKAYVNGQATEYFANDHLTVRRATSVFWMVSGEKFEVLFDKNGRWYIRLSPDYHGKVSVVVSPIACLL